MLAPPVLATLRGSPSVHGPLNLHPSEGSQPVSRPALDTATMPTACWHPKQLVLRLIPGASLAIAAVLLSGGVVSVQAAIQGGARAVPYAEALGRSRAAAVAVLSRAGTESCLRGKLTNALLGLLASCESRADRGDLCTLADRAVTQLGWTMPFMDATARDVIRLIDLSSAP